MDTAGHRTVVLACLLVIIGAGAVSGVAVSGTIAGDGSTTVEQSIIIVEDEFSADNVTTDNVVVEINEQGTRFTTSAEAFQGETYSINIPIESRSETETTVRLRFAQAGGPSDLVLDAQATGQDEFNDSAEIGPVVQVSADTYRFQVDAESADRVQLRIKVPAHAKPGFYNVTGTIEPIDGTPSE